MHSKGKKLEFYVAEKLKKLYKYSRPTIASGATPIEKGDVSNPYFCIECVPPGSFISIPDGYKSIEKILTGDQVLAGNGTITQVKKVFKRKFTGKLYKIKTSGFNKELFITEEHSILYRYNYNYKENFIKAKNIYKEYNKSKSYLKNCYVSSPTPNRDKRLLKNKFLSKENKVKINSDTIKLFGYYLSEGFCMLDNNKYKVVMFTFGGKEDNYTDELIEIIKKITKCNPRKYKRKTVINIRVRSDTLYNILFNTFGTGAKEKIIPGYFINLDDNLLKTLLKYMIRGDGHRDTRCVHYSSYSNSILKFVKEIATVFKFSFNLDLINGQIRLYGTPEELSVICDKTPTKMVERSGKSRRKIKFINNKSWHRIKHIDTTYYNGYVYNLETESNDYICNNFIVHNCKNWNTESFSIKDPVWYKLMGEAAGEGKDPVYIVENKSGRKLAIMDLEDWILLVTELIELREQTNL